MVKDETRREFIKIGGLVAMASFFPWLKVLGQENKSKNPSDLVKLGFIGIGSRGYGLMQNVIYMINNDKINVEITAVCDDYQPHYERANKDCGNPKVKAFKDYRKLLEMDEIDAVIIATPLYNHAEITVAAMDAGKHVFCEKSISKTLDQAKAMYDTHIEKNKILQIGHQRLFNPRFVEGIERIKKGELGIIGQIRAYWHRNGDWRRPVPEGHPELERKINWRLYREYSAGLLTELASHQIQVANWALGKVPASVMGTGSIRYWKDGREIWDNVANIFTYDDGTQFIYDSMISNKKYGLQEQIMGDLGTMELETNKVYREKPPAAPGIRELINDIEHSIFDNIPIGGATWVPETAVKYKGEYITDNWEVNETKLQLEAFVQYIRQGKAPEMLTREGYNAGIWTLLAEEAIDTGKKLEMPEKYII